MKNLNKTFMGLVLTLVVCAVCVFPLTTQKRSVKKRVATQKPARADGGRSAYTLMQLRQEFERREAVGKKNQEAAKVFLGGVEKSKSASLSRSSIATAQPITSPLETLSDLQLLDLMHADSQSVYGKDSRKDANKIQATLRERNQVPNVANTGFKMDEAAVFRNVNSVAAMMSEERLVDDGHGKTTIRPIGAYGEIVNLCPGELFRTQPVAAHCTGFLVAPNVMATASHCLRQVSLERTRFVFGYVVLNSGPALIVKSSEVYRAVRIIKMVPSLSSTRNNEQDGGADWALVELDRRVPAADHLPVKIRSEGQIALGEPLYVIGFPEGLPLKYADGAFVRANAARAYFVSNLDTFHGNSGSPVFNAKTNLLEGILVRGEDDYDEKIVSGRPCRIPKACTMEGCRGEDCTRSTEFVGHIVPIQR